MYSLLEIEYEFQYIYTPLPRFCRTHFLPHVLFCEYQPSLHPEKQMMITTCVYSLTKEIHELSTMLVNCVLRPIEIEVI